MTDDQIEFGSGGIEDGTRRQVIFPCAGRVSHHVTARFLAMDREAVLLWESVYLQ